MLVNSNAGSVNPNITHNDSVIFANSPIVNGGLLFLTTYSADRRSISYIRINVNTIDIGSAENSTSVVRITCTFLVNNCTNIFFNSNNVTFTTPPTCDGVPILPSHFVNKAYADSNPNFYTKSQNDTSFTNYYTKSQNDTSFTNYYTKSQNDTTGLAAFKDPKSWTEEVTETI
jgi:hypothetical protein